MSYVIVTQGLSKRYGHLLALDGLSVRVPRGAIFALLGPNGAGKTTTFGLLCGFLRQSAGTARLLDVDSRELHRLRGRVGALPQDAALPRLVRVDTALAHYARLSGVPKARARDRAREVLARVGLESAAAMRCGALSHGMAKRVALAQAIVGEPEVVLLDEPTAGLDPASAREVKDLIVGLAPATVVVSSHNLAEVQETCTHGAILDRGKLVWTGAMSELTRSAGEVTVETREGVALPLEQLRAALPGAHCTQRGAFLSVGFAAERDVSEVIGRVLRVLLDAQVPVLGVRRGTTLEAAFLELVKPKTPDEGLP